MFIGVNSEYDPLSENLIQTNYLIIVRDLIEIN